MDLESLKATYTIVIRLSENFSPMTEFVSEPRRYRLEKSRWDGSCFACGWRVAIILRLEKSRAYLIDSSK